MLRQRTAILKVYSNRVGTAILAVPAGLPFHLELQRTGSGGGAGCGTHRSRARAWAVGEGDVILYK